MCEVIYKDRRCPHVDDRCQLDRPAAVAANCLAMTWLDYRRILCEHSTIADRLCELAAQLPASTPKNWRR